MHSGAATDSSVRAFRASSKLSSCVLATELPSSSPRLCRSQANQATASACAVNNINLVKGAIGRVGASVFQFNGQPTAQVRFRSSGSLLSDKGIPLTPYRRTTASAAAMASSLVSAIRAIRSTCKSWRITGTCGRIFRPGSSTTRG